MMEETANAPKEGRHRIDHMLRDIIGSIQIRKNSVTLDRIAWPVGTVLLWYGSPSDVPEGWQICDGTRGTPNMNAAYARGITSGSVGGTGGSNTHVLTAAQLPSHRHTISASGDHSHPVALAVSTGSDWCALTEPGYTKGDTMGGGDHSHGGYTGYEGSGAAHNNEPKYVNFYYIMYVGS